MNYLGANTLRDGGDHLVRPRLLRLRSVWGIVSLQISLFLLFTSLLRYFHVDFLPVVVHLACGTGDRVEFLLDATNAVM